MARNKFDVDETLEAPFQWKHLKRAFQYIGRHRFQMIGALALSVLLGFSYGLVRYKKLR